MSRSLLLLPLAAIVAVLAVSLLPGGSARPSPASAEDCTLGNTGTLEIEIIDVATDDPLGVDGAQVLIKPDPRDFVLDDVVVDTAITDANTSQDRDPETGIIRIEGACSTEGSESYTATLFALPDSLKECSIEVSSDSTQLTADETEELTLEVDCTGVGPTATVTVTATAGPAATIVANTSPLSVTCSGTSVVSVTVRDAAGNAVKAGTAVTITTTLGSISPSSGHVTNDAGAVFTFFTAPAATGGTATITAKAGSASGTTYVNVNCGATAGGTVAPPPTTTSSSVITPPSTGDGGLVAAPGRSAFPATIVSLASVVALGLALTARVRPS